MNAEKTLKRTVEVNMASNRLSQAVLDIQKEFSLTYPEVMYILFVQGQTWSKYAIKEEGETK